MNEPNLERERIRAFLAAPGLPLALDCSPLLAALGARIVAASDGRIGLHFEPAALFLQGSNVVQGGAVSAMLDFTMAAAMMTQLERDTSFATASLTVSFLAPVRPGLLQAEGHIDRIGRRNGFARANLTDREGTVLATASCVLTLLPSGQ